MLTVPDTTCLLLLFAYISGQCMSIHVDYARSATQSVSHDGVDHQNLSTPMTPGGGEFPERISMGGESLGSYSEFETVSFADESGQKPSRL